MTVLSRLADVRIQGLYFTETQRLTLSEVGLEEASDTGSGRIALAVEICACPPAYAGDSCQVGNFPIRNISLGSSCGRFWLLSSTVGWFGALCLLFLCSSFCRAYLISYLDSLQELNVKKTSSVSQNSQESHRGSIDAEGQRNPGQENNVLQFQIDRRRILTIPNTKK